MKKINFLIFALLLLFIMFISLDTISSASYTVVGNSFDDIQNVVNLGSPGSIVILDNITYKGSGVDIRVNKTLTIQGKSKNKFATLDARKSSRIFSISNVSYVNFKYISFINGNAVNKAGSLFNGGAINSNSKLYIADCNFRNNTGSNGGAIYSTKSLSIVNTNFNSNNAINGGGIRVSASAIIKGSTFTLNKATNGGAIYSSSGLTIDMSSFSYNQVRNYGGALYLNKVASIRNSQFVSNSAYRGAAIYSNDKLTISKSYFKSNKACIRFYIYLKDRVIKYGKTRVIAKFESNNNVRATYANHAIWSNKIKNLKINGKSVKKYVFSTKTRLGIKINNRKAKINSKRAYVDIKTYPTYKWRDYNFKVSYGGNSYINKTISTYKVSARIVSTSVHNIDKNKRFKYYVPYRKDKLQVKINNNYYTKTISQKASSNVYLLGGEKIPQDLHKFLDDWKGVADVNESSIKKRVITIFILKSKTYGVKGELTPLKKTRSILKWVSKNLRYISRADLGGSVALKKRYGNCAGYTNLFVSLARTAGIPTSYLYIDPAGYYTTHVLSLIYIKSGRSWKVYRIEPQIYKIHYTGWRPSIMEDFGPDLNYNVYGHELAFPHWYSKRSSDNFIRYLSFNDYWNPNYKKGAYLEF